MRKLLRSRKAMSPVIAAIILIAVTVAVSIAVAAWMGALTIGFMKTEELKVIGHDFGLDPKNATLVVQNTGTAKVTISEIRANDVVQNITSFTVDGSNRLDSKFLDAGEKATIVLDLDWKAGTKYEFTLVTATGNKFMYVATAPT